MNILEEIAEKTKKRVAKRKQEVPFKRIRDEAMAIQTDTEFPFERALEGEGVSLICEVKKASPSKGLIVPDFPYCRIAEDYEEAGAAAVSVLTEPYFFQGSDEYLAEIHKVVSLPLLRKDFIVDEYMIYEAKIIGASAVLLICSLLDEETLKRYIEIADSLGLSALVEVHNEKEIEQAVSAGVRVIGVNNRDLKTFTVDIRNSIRLRKLVPDGILFVSESGISNPANIKELSRNRVDAALVGESLMRAGDIRGMLVDLVAAGGC